jgi:transposase
MRGHDSKNESLFAYVTPESFVPADHPLRAIRKMADEALAGMDQIFDSMYAGSGRGSIPPERLLKAQLLMILYSIRSNRQIVEHIHYNFLFRWFLGMSLDEVVWDHSSFTKNQERLIGSDVAAEFLSRILAFAKRKHLLSREHFTVDGTLIEAWASVKSFKPKDGPPSTGGGGRNETIDFRGKKLTNDTHGSVTDPDAKLYRKGPGKESKLSYLGHTLMENRSGLIVRTAVTVAGSKQEREAALDMITKLPRTSRRITLGADKGYDTMGFIQELRARNITPHIARNDGNHSRLDGRTTRHPNYSLSQKIRKRIEEGFGWMKTIGRLRKTMYRGIAKIGWHLDLHAAAYNLVRMKNMGLGVT